MEPPTVIRLGGSPLTVQADVEALKHPNCGAIVRFDGIVRADTILSIGQDEEYREFGTPEKMAQIPSCSMPNTMKAKQNDDTPEQTSSDPTPLRKIVTHLEYEVYPKMFYKQVQKLIDEIRLEYPTVYGVLVAHTGSLCAVGETGVTVMTSAPHRKEAFRACESLLDRIKDTAPDPDKPVIGELVVAI